MGRPLVEMSPNRLKEALGPVAPDENHVDSGRRGENFGATESEIGGGA